MIVEVFGKVAVIYDEQDGARGNGVVMVKEVGQLGGGDRLKTHFVQVVHQFALVGGADLIGAGGLAFADGVEHDDHHYGARLGFTAGPFVMQVLAGILNVGVWLVKRVEQGGGKERGQGWWGADGSSGGEGGGGGDDGLGSLGERDAQRGNGLGHRGVQVGGGEGGCRPGSAGAQKNGEQAQCPDEKRGMRDGEAHGGDFNRKSPVLKPGFGLIRCFRL